MECGNDTLPPIVALFVTAFDSRTGYELIWQRSEVDLTACEYKTFPSGIEKVPQDSVYFTQGSCVGLAAYRNLRNDGHERAKFSCFSIAILVEAESTNLRHQRLNKIWLYNSVLRDLAQSFDPAAAGPYATLETLYEQSKAPAIKSTPPTRKSQSPPASPVLSRESIFQNYQSFRSQRQDTFSKAATLLPTQELSNLHPVLSLHDCISLFGPLIFPLYRAALARKRILLLTPAPVQRACHFIYNIQLLSAIPNQASTMRRPSPLRQLFCLGLNDIPMLEQLGNSHGESNGWIGVTTDQALESRNDLWDVLIRLPPESSTNNLAEARDRPSLTTNRGLPIRPSYLDAHNFSQLRAFLPMYRHTGLRAYPQPSWKRSLLDNLVSGLWYWASAGQSLSLDEYDYQSQDAQNSHEEAATRGIMDVEEEETVQEGGEEDSRHRASEATANGRDEVVVLALFHRMTTNILGLLEELCCESLDDLKISREEMVKVGLTPRLQQDVACMEDLSRRWFGRDVIVDKSFWPCC